MKHKWPLTPLGEVLTERRETPSDVGLASGRVRIIEKISFDTGRIHLRVDGSTRTGMILVRPGDLVVSGINAAKGAIAIYNPEAEDPLAATIHYGAYIPNPGRVEVRFLWWMLRSRFFQDLLNEYVPGGIKTELKAKRLLPVPVPLPLPSEQRRIVERLDELTTHIEEARRLRREAVHGAEALVRSVLRTIIVESSVSGRLSDIFAAPPRNGWSARCDNEQEGTAVLALSAITGFRYRATGFKRTSLPVPANAHCWLRPNDLLISRSNTLEFVGHAAIYDGDPSPCIYPDLMMKLEILDDKADRRFVWYWLQSPMVRDFIAQKAKGTSPSMKKISQGVVMAIPFPSPLSIETQRRIVTQLDVLQVEVDRLKSLQAKTAEEIDALLPAILDRAFKGEL